MWRSLREKMQLPRVPGAGERLGPYRLEDVLGEGGMGIVLKAIREPDGEVCALKILRPEISGDPVYQKRFAHEARAAREVQHRHLVPIVDVGEIEGIRYIASRYVVGRTLRARIRDEGALPIEEVGRVTAQIASGLDALHAQGLMHRDVKPSNILLDEEGDAFLTDFGLSKGRGYTVLTKAGQVMGTLDYLAPELIRGAKATPASDIYALGCVVFEAITGQPPFGHRSPFEVGAAHLEEDPPNPSHARAELTSRAAWAMLRALQKDPKDRPATASMYSNLLLTAVGTPGEGDAP